MKTTRMAENKNVAQILRIEDKEAQHLVVTIIEPNKESPLAALQIDAAQFKEDTGRPAAFLMTLFSRNSSDAGFTRLSAAIPAAVSGAHCDETLDEPEYLFPSKDRAARFVQSSGAATYAVHGIKSMNLYPPHGSKGAGVNPYAEALKVMQREGLISPQVQECANRFIERVSEKDMLSKGESEQRVHCEGLVQSQQEAGKKGARGGRE